MFRTIKDKIRRSNALLNMPDIMLWDHRAVDLERSLWESDRQGVSPERITDREVVISLTTYGKRLEQVHLTIESLLRQTLQPNRIVLWLDDNVAGQRLPAALLKQCHRGLDIRYTPDIRSYKKLLPALEAFPESHIITVDDDLIYDCCMVDRLVRTHERHPLCVIATAALRLESDRDFSRRHLDKYYDVEAMDLLPLGGCGTLYPQGIFDKEIFNMEAIKKLCPLADDIWFRAMSLKTGTPVVRVCTPSADGWDLIMNYQVQDTALWHENVDDKKNEEQYAAVMTSYKLSFASQG